MSATLPESAASAARCMRLAATLLRDAGRPKASLALLAAAVDLERAIEVERPTEQPQEREAI